MKASEGDFPIICPRIHINADSDNVTKWSPGVGLGSVMLMRESKRGLYPIYIDFLKHFTRELGYPWPGPEAETLGVGQVVYLIFHRAGRKTGVDAKLDSIAIGFVRMAPSKNNPGLEHLEDCWIHPAFRGRGILSAKWGWLKSIHGDFMVKPPHSHAMVGFMAKHRIDWAGATRPAGPMIIESPQHKGKQDVTKSAIDRIIA